MDASSNYSGSSESIALDETYYKNQPPPLNYESIKENIIKIDNIQCTVRNKQRDGEVTNRIEIEPPRYGKLNNYKYPFGSNQRQRSQPIERRNPHNRRGGGFASSRNYQNRNGSLQSNFPETRKPEPAQCRAEFKSEVEEPIETDMCTRILSFLCNVCFC
ncbi:unnamed protein product [Callosobruchus maculatus]|nr:unnamed protein product [Callosobruchus maculatus]